MLRGEAVIHHDTPVTGRGASPPNSVPPMGQGRVRPPKSLWLSILESRGLVAAARDPRFPICLSKVEVCGGVRAELPVRASEPPPAPPPSLLPSQRHYKSNGLERKASKILKPSSIINADNKFPLGAFYIATVTKTGWWGGCSSPPQPTDLGGVLAVTLPSPHLSLLATTWVPTRLSP